MPFISTTSVYYSNYSASTLLDNLLNQPIENYTRNAKGKNDYFRLFNMKAPNKHLNQDRAKNLLPDKDESTYFMNKTATPIHLVSGDLNFCKRSVTGSRDDKNVTLK